jgi:hypothetical protein
MKSIHEALMNVQKELKAPKSQRNNFGNYNYRSQEDILEAVKPLLHDNGLHMIISDEIQVVGERVYVKATVTISNGDKELSVSASARESLSKKGMDESQITGATSSYARKYALNGLFLIDDTKDADATNDHKEEDLQKKFLEALGKTKDFEDLNNLMTFSDFPREIWKQVGKNVLEQAEKVNAQWDKDAKQWMPK